MKLGWKHIDMVLGLLPRLRYAYREYTATMGDRARRLRKLRGKVK